MTSFTVTPLFALSAHCSHLFMNSAALGILNYWFLLPLPDPHEISQVFMDCHVNTHTCILYTLGDCLAGKVPALIPVQPLVVV